MRSRFYIVWIFLLCCLQGFQTIVPAETNNASLFEDEYPLDVVLKADFNEILGDRGEVREYHAATISWNDSLRGKGSLPLELMVRGNFRRSKANCAFPPLKLNFDKDSTAGTVFSGQNKLKLVTHCQNGKSYQQFILEEYLMYKLYNELTDYSFKVRLLRIVYEDESGKMKPVQYYGFLIEDDGAMAARNDAKVVELEGIHPNETNKDIEVLLSMFEFMIGNTDWSIPGLHNIEMLHIANGEPPIVVPYDFDWCGLISAPYAKPNTTLGINTVRERLYRGFCASDSQWKNCIDRFNAEKADIYTCFERCPGIDDKIRKRAFSYLDDFYDIINTEKRFEREVLSQCR